MKKRLLAILLAAIMVVSLLPITAFADVTKPEGAEWLVNEGDNHVWYELTEGDTVLTIGGTGAMPDYANGKDRPWYSDANSITSVVIEDGVTVIGKRAFLNFANVTKLTVPASVKKVSAYAFKNSGLEAGITFAGKKAPTFMDHALDEVEAIKVPLKKIDAYKEAVGEDLAGIVNGYVNVTLNANGGTGDDKLVVVEGDSYPLPATDFTAPADKEFAGWARKAHGQVITDENITLTDDITLYAIWKSDTALSDAESILDAAKDFEYDDGGQYNGVFTITGTTIVYSAPKNLPDPNKPDELNNYKKLITNDFGAFFGTLYRFDNGASVTSIFYKGDEYTWDTEGTLRGSNWKKGGNGDTLISQLGNEIQAETGSANITFKLNEDDVNLIAQTGLICTGKEGPDYEWSGDELIIKSSGLTVSGATSTQYITVNDGVTSLTLNGVKIIPTMANVVFNGLDSYSGSLTIILAEESTNQIGNTVEYNKDTTSTSDYFVQTGIYSPYSLTFTGKGSLTIYDEYDGIEADNVTFDKDFTGTLTVEDYGQTGLRCAISAIGDVELLGGTFVLKSYNKDGIHAGGDVTIDNATVTINSGGEELDPGEGIGVNGIYVKNGNVTISGEADVAAGGKEYGIYVDKGTVRIGTASTDTIAVSADGYFGGVRVADGDIEINTGTVKARAHKWGIGVGKKVAVDGDVLGSGNVTISGQNTKVVAFGGIESPVDTDNSKEYNYKWGCGIYALGVTGGDKGAVTIKDGAGVIAKGYDYGIGAENKVSIQGAMTNVSAEGGYSYGLEEKDSFENNNAKDDVFAYGIFSNDKIVVMGGTVTAKGCDGAMNKDPILDYYQVLIDGVNTPSWRVLAGDDAENATRPEGAGWSENEYAEIFSMILKEKLDVDESGKIVIGYSKVGATKAKLACYGVSYDKDNKILKLDGFMQNMSAVELTVEEDANNAYAIRLPDGATLELNGKNTIQAPHTTGNKSCGILGTGTLYINSGKESGSLTLTAGNAPVTKGKSFGIYSSGDLSIVGSVKLNVTAGNGKVAYGISGAENISITSGTISVKNGDAANTIAVAVDTANSKTLTVGDTGKTAQLQNVRGGLNESAGIVTGGKLTAANGTYPMVISFVPIIVVEKKNEADYPVAGEENAQYQLYAVSAENVASGTTLKLEWKDGDAWNGSAPTGVTLDTEGKIITTTATVAGNYIFRLTNNVDEFIDDPAPDTPNPAFVSSGEVVLTVTAAYAITNGAPQTSVNDNHGYLDIDKTTAAAKDTVTVTVTPSSGYLLTADSLKVTYTDGNAQPQTITPTATQTAGEYTFTMPAYAVTVTAEFTELVAKIGTTGYATLAEAVKAAKAGETVTLLKDITITEQVEIDKAITLDGSGKKIDGSAVEGAGAILVTAGATLKNFELTGPNSNDSKWDSGEFGIKFYQAAGAVLDGVTVTGANAGIQVNGGSVAMTGTITLTGNEFGGIELCKSGELDISNATLKNDGETDANPVLWNDDTKGTITQNTSQMLYVKAADANKDHYYLSGEAQLDSLVSESRVSTGYRSFTEALAAAKTGDTVTLLKDITESTMDVTVLEGAYFDLNHHVLKTTGTVVNNGCIILHQENADIVDYLLYNVPGNYATSEMLKLPNDQNPDYVIPEGTFMTAKVGTNPAYQELGFASGDEMLVWNKDVPAGMQLDVVYSLTLGGNILSAKTAGIKDTNVTAVNFALNDDISIGSNTATDGAAVLNVTSIYDELFDDTIATFAANGKKITLNKTGKLVISSDATGFNESVLVSGVQGMRVTKTEDKTTGTVTYFIETPAPTAGEGYSINYAEEEVTVEPGYEISKSKSPFSAETLTDAKMTVAPNTTYYVRKAAAGEAPASAATGFTTAQRPVAPSGVTAAEETVENKKDGALSGITEAMEYSTDNGTTWTPCPERLTGFSNETVKVRYKATTTAFKSEEYSYTFTPSTATLTVSFGDDAESQQLAYGAKVVKPADPEKTGYTFGGWYADEACTQAWNFGTDTVTEDMTLYPKWIRNAVQKAAITGKVTEGSTGVPGATVELFLGTVKVAATVTDASGNYSFDNVENGVYNIVVTKDGKTKTEMVTVDTTNTFTKDVELPSKAVSSVVEVQPTEIGNVKSDISKTVVGGLDEIAKNTTVSGADKVTIKLTVVPKDESEVPSATEIKQTAGNGKKVEFLDMSLWKQVNTEEPNDIGDSNTQLLTIVIPFDFSGVDVSSVMIIRKHGEGPATTLTTTPNNDGEYFTVDRQAGTITLYAMKFSDYALAYGEQSSGGGSGGASSYAVTVESAKNGTISVDKKSASPGSTVTITVAPDKGFTLETLTVLDKNGKEVEVKNLGNGKYSFKMPASKATVSATFMEDNSMLNFFVDVKATDYYYDAVLWAAENDITKGTDAVHFSPDAPVTRAQAVTFLWRAAGCPKLLNMTANGPAPSPFKDVATDAYYYDAVMWAVSEGITKGTSDTTFSPDMVCTRAHIVSFLARFAGVADEDAGYTHGFTDVKAADYFNNAVAWAFENKVTEGTSATTFSPNTDCTRAQVVTFLYRWMVK